MDGHDADKPLKTPSGDEDTCSVRGEERLIERGQVEVGGEEGRTEEASTWKSLMIFGRKLGDGPEKPRRRIGFSFSLE